jgi:hypothetical protein
MALSSNEGESSNATFFRPPESSRTGPSATPCGGHVSVELKCGNPDGYWCFERSGLASVGRIHKPAHDRGLGFRLSPHRGGAKPPTRLS